jgi:hypothetical protein
MANPLPAGWLPDPTRRHTHRYWDGAAWTEYVGDHGIMRVERPTLRRWVALLGVALGLTAAASTGLILWMIFTETAREREDPFLAGAAEAALAMLVFFFVTVPFAVGGLWAGVRILRDRWRLEHQLDLIAALAAVLSGGSLGTVFVVVAFGMA